MGKAIGKIAIGAAIIGAAFLTGGASLVPTLAAGASATAAVSVSVGLALSTTALGSALLLAGAATALGGLTQAVGLGPKVPKATLSRLNLSFDPNAPRAIVFGGPTAMGTDLVYYEPSGTDQEYVDYIIAVAAHKVASIDSIYTDDKLMWTAAGGVQSPYTGYLTVATRTEGTSANAIAINGGTTWSTDCRLTGCAYVHLRIKRSGNDKKATSPFAGGLSSRITIIGKGIPVYDPRYDSTRGGSGSMRADDQTTWAFTQSSADIGKLTSNQLLTYLLGWKIGGVVSVGAGLPVDRIDFADFITAANICDDSVAKASGTHARYETAGMFNDDDAPVQVIESLCLHMNAEPRDTSGKLGVRIATNDLSGTLLELTEDDILGPVQWDEGPGLEDSPNVVRGRYTDASTASLYQLAPYPSQSYTSVDGVNRHFPLDLPLIDDAERAQRVAAQVLNRGKFQGRLTAPFGPRALAAPAGTPVRLTFGPRGFSSKIFRVERQDIRVAVDAERVQAFCPMVLIEEDASIYTAPTTTEADAPVAAPSFDDLNQPLIQAIVEVGTADGTTFADGTTLESRSTLGDNLCVNPWLTDGGTDGLFPAALYPSGPPSVVTIQTAASLSGASMTPPNAHVMQIEGAGSDQYGNGPVLYDGPARAGETIFMDALFGRYAVGSSFTANGGLFIIFWAKNEAGTTLDFNVSRTVEVADVAGGTFQRLRFNYQCPAGTATLYVAIGTKAALSSGKTWLTVGWRVARAQSGADVTVEQPVVQLLNPTTGRVDDPTMYNTQAVLGPRNATDVVPTMTDNGTNVTVSISAHVRTIAGPSGPVTLSYGSGSVTVAYSTQFWVYADDPNLTGIASPTYVLTTDPDDLLYPGRYEVCSATSIAPGAPPEDAYPGGGYGGGFGYPFP